VFLRIMAPWPNSLLDWDILFLLPLPWWGPVMAPVSIAVLMIAWGTIATQSREDAAEPRWSWALAGAGITLALGVFMIDAWRALPDGREAVMRVLPVSFNWPLFSFAWLLMASPVVHQVVFSATPSPPPSSADEAPEPRRAKAPSIPASRRAASNGLST